MALPSLVLVHGALHAGDCWDPTVAAISRLDPELVVVAVDLPGRRDKAGDLIAASIDEWANSVTSDIDGAGVNDLVIVGHSMAGLVVPCVVTKLGSARVREMILATAFVPPDGGAMVDTVPGAWGGMHDVPRSAMRRKACLPPCRISGRPTHSVTG